MRRISMRFGKNPNEPETGVNLRQHEIYTDTDGMAMKTGRRAPRGRYSDAWDWAKNGYRVIARRPRSEIFTESVSPERADAIEEFTEGLMPPDRW
jgi:hypothetical protein